MTSTDFVSFRRDDPLTKSLGIVIGVLILLVGLATYGALLMLYAFTSFLLLYAGGPRLGGPYSVGH